MDGGSHVARVLGEQGVRSVYTLCGGHISPILVACKREGIAVIDVRHEVNAAFAADATARLTGVPGVAVVTAGPGVTNTVTAVKNAQLAQSPLVVIGGATATMLRGRGSLQDIDQLAVMRPHVKWLARPSRVAEIAPTLERAFRIACAPTPGPVFVELAVDLLYDEKVVRSWYESKSRQGDPSLADRALQLYIRGHLAYLFDLPALPRPRLPLPQLPLPDLPLLRRRTVAPSPEPSATEIRKARSLLAAAERPVLVVGSQAMGHPEEVGDLVEAVERLGVPVWLSGMARGLLGKDHPLQRRHKRSKALREADVVLLAGVPCDFRLDYGSHVARARVISVNLSGHDLYLNCRPKLGVLADPHRFLVALAAGWNPPAQRWESWRGKLAERDAERQREILAKAHEPTEHIHPVAACLAIERQLSDESIIVGDGGDFVATASYIVQPRGPLRWLDPGVFGTLGVGAGFAMGAKRCRPEADVWLLWGDGAAGFSLAEIDTLVRHELPVICVVGNDACWSQIAREQVEILGDDCALMLARTDYHRVAEGFGARGIVVRKPDELDDALSEALRLSRAGHTVLVNVWLGRSDFRKGSISM